jgi:uncharacterized membrane protein YphA (DoxX/SURF4 family)
MTASPHASARWGATLAVIRVFLGITFATYGLVKVLGGQHNYDDWVIDKKTVDGTSLVWAFYGYSPFYGRFTGLFELVPAILLLIPRTATIGAAALFAVALNVTAMDFGFDYPAVKYFALVYTILLGVLLGSTGRNCPFFCLTVSKRTGRISANSLPRAAGGPVFSRLPAGCSSRSPRSRARRANIAALSISKGPEPVARRPGCASPA